MLPRLFIAPRLNAGVLRADQIYEKSGLRAVQFRTQKNPNEGLRADQAPQGWLVRRG